MLRLDKVTDLLCAVCRELPPGMIATIANGRLQTWWEEHRQLDGKNR